mmetsp:Transcript_130120/g.183599  ORF Transcript_130120/g.183599 Transcript_130120/m.183599 type:complete len:108 (+) Transcript_130120:297-620(+)
MGLSYSSYETNERCGGGNDDFFLDNLNCRGTESHINDCTSYSYINENCGSTECVSVICGGALSGNSGGDSDEGRSNAGAAIGYSILGISIAILVTVALVKKCKKQAE